MRKQVFGRRLKRDKNERKALFNGLISAMVLEGRIQTTEQKAKSIKGDLDKIVTKAKKEEKVARRLLQSLLKPYEVEKMITQIAPGFKNRNGGYTRIIKTRKRFNDNASMVILEWVEGEAFVPAKKSPAPKSVSREPRTTKASSKPSAKKVTAKPVKKTTKKVAAKEKK